MKDGSSCENSTYYNEFIDLREAFPLKSRIKLKTTNLDNIKIASKKLPPDFFRPHTRENPNQHEIIQRQGALKTPCFGDDKKQSFSLSLIPKNKRNLDSSQPERIQRIATMPVNDAQQFYRANKKIFNRDFVSKEQQYSYRHSKKKQLTRAQHQSTQRQKIKYKKLTLNDQIYLDEKKMLNLQSQNRIRLNIKKFFKEENQFHTLEINNQSGRKPVLHLNKLQPLQLYSKSNKPNKLPPLL